MFIVKSEHRERRKRRVRARISGTKDRPRLCLYRSLTQITAQLIDDDSGRTLVAASTRHVKAKPTVEGAKKLGEEIAKRAKVAKITTVVFDRSGYKYHGRAKALAEAAREGGIKF